MSVLRDHADDIVGVQEIAERAGVTVSAVHKWRSRYEDSPEPVKNVGTDAGPHFIWDWNEWKEWIDERE